MRYQSILNELRERIEQTDYRHVSFSFLTGYYAEVVRQSDEEIRHITEDLDVAERELVRLKERMQKLEEEGKSGLRILEAKKYSWLKRLMSSKGVRTDSSS
ncbi:MAG: hypothetical protein HZT42_01970 [Paracoccaceae bacterium]|nr:MAG: hypothetical protein HZT42_01970 [Paracoccaceae bacterium]